MNFDTRINQSLGVSQQLNLAPQLLQWLRLLQLPTTELFGVVQQELEINPSLEIDETPPETAPATDEFAEAPAILEGDPEPTSFDEADLGSKLEMLTEMDQDWGNESPSTTDSAERNEKRQFMLNSVSGSATLQEHLSRQLQSMRAGADVAAAAEVVIGSLDRRGYLTASQAELEKLCGAPTATVTAAVKLVQSMDPAGIGARDLRECLLLQIEDHTTLAARMIGEYLDALGRRQYREIAEALAVEEEEVMEALGEIRGLNPAPGENFNNEHTHYIKADVTIHRTGDGYVIELNDKYMPRLRITPYCREMLDQGALKGGDSSYLRKKIRTSSFLIQGIRQRQETMRKVSTAILHYQRDFFDSEDGVLKPLTMAQVAKDINVHETTVSRALANKYIQTPRGLFEMKHFFRAGYQCEDGSAMIAAEVKELIARLVDQEPPARPLTDLDIAARCKEQGINLARRTVAKYREELGIASSKERQYHHRKPAIRLATPANDAVAPADTARPAIDEAPAPVQMLA